MSHYGVELKKKQQLFKRESVMYICTLHKFKEILFQATYVPRTGITFTANVQTAMYFADVSVVQYHVTEIDRSSMNQLLADRNTRPIVKGFCSTLRFKTGKTAKKSADDKLH